MYNLGKITNSKDLIKSFMEVKDEILFDLTGIHLYSDDDYKDVDSWDDGICKRMDLSAYEDFQCCPACIRYNINCDKCRYGMVHGICVEGAGNYRNIVNKLREEKGVWAFCLLDSIEKLIESFNYKQELLRLGASSIDKFYNYNDYIE